MRKRLAAAPPSPTAPEAVHLTCSGLMDAIHNAIAGHRTLRELPLHGGGPVGYKKQILLGEFETGPSGQGCRLRRTQYQECGNQTEFHSSNVSLGKGRETSDSGFR